MATGVFTWIATRRASKDSSQKIAVGDMVLLKKDNTSRCFWNMAKVEELIPGQDGKIARSALYLSPRFCLFLVAVAFVQCPLIFGNQVHHLNSEHCGATQR